MPKTTRLATLLEFRPKPLSVFRDQASPHVHHLSGLLLILGTLKKASAAASSGYWLGPPLIRACVRPKICPASPCSARLRPAAAGSRRVAEDGAAPNHLSTCHRPACGPFAARLDARALRWSCARTPKSGQLVPVQRPTDGAECARVLCRCGAAKAPTQRAARRNRRRMWCLGLRLDAQGGGGGGGDRTQDSEASCARHRHATVMRRCRVSTSVNCRNINTSKKARKKLTFDFALHQDARVMSELLIPGPPLLSLGVVLITEKSWTPGDAIRLRVVTETKENVGDGRSSLP